MRLFNAKLLDHFLEGSGAYIDSSESWDRLITRADSIRFICIVDEVTGTPTLTVSMYASALDTADDGTVLVNSLVSSSTIFSASYTPQSPTYPPLRHVFLQATISGAGTKAHVQLWACGRGPQLLEPMPAVTGSFAEQYAMAKLLAEESRVPSKRMVLRQGQSVFYPPELFLSSSQWER